MNSPKSIRGLLIALFALALLPAAAAAAPKVDGTPFPVPVPGLLTENKIVEGQDGNMWVTVDAAGGEDVARITPSGEVKEYELKTGIRALEGAAGIARDAEGHLWVTGEGKVAKFTPADPPGSVAVEDLAQAKGAAVGGSSIVLGPDGNMWIATTENVIKFPPDKPDPETTRTLFSIGGLAPHDIDVAGGLLVIADQNSRIVTLTTAGAEKNYALDSFSQGVAGMKSGMIAYSEPGAKVVGLITPPNALAPIKTPEPGGDPFGVTVGADGAFWFVMGAFNTLARLEPGGTQLTFVEGLPKEGLSRQIAPGPNNTLYVTVTKAESESVARVSGLEPPGSKTGGGGAAPETKITTGPKRTVKTRGRRAKVSFRFSSPDAGTSFECRLIRLAGKGKKSKTPGFAACKSPKTYRLRPGRYRFEVRAMLGGVADKSPETRSFRVVHVGRHRHR